MEEVWNKRGVVGSRNSKIGKRKRNRREMRGEETIMLSVKVHTL